MAFLIQQVFLYTVPLLIVALAGIYAERSGIINLALEGGMVIGAFSGVLTVRLLQQSGFFTTENGQLLLLIAFVVSGAVGAAFSLLLSFAAVNLKANQTISGTALNMLAPALSLFLINIIARQSALNMAKGDAAEWFMIFKTDFGFERNQDIGLLGEIFLNKAYLTTYLCILLYIVLSVLLYKTRFGLRLRACGENPQAANSLGINVSRMRYAGTTISGMLAGIGGFVYALTTANCSSTGEVAGFGFIALAIMIFGNWKPLNTAGAAFLFGLFKCIAATYNDIDLNGDGVYLLREIGISRYFYLMMPYIITLLVLVFTSKSSRAPKAEGIPYDKSMR